MIHTQASTTSSAPTTTNNNRWRRGSISLTILSESAPCSIVTNDVKRILNCTADAASRALCSMWPSLSACQHSRAHLRHRIHAVKCS
jgi:hypothetical protein